MLKYEFVQIDYTSASSPKQRRQREHEVAYSLLDKMLLAEGTVDYEISRSENGKPYIKDCPIHFNLSHTQGLCAVAVSDVPVGIDCEKIDTGFEGRILPFAKRYFCEDELNKLNSSSDMLTTFFEIWTGKEAMIKRDGLNGSYVKMLDTTKTELKVIRYKDYIISIFN